MKKLLIFPLLATVQIYSMDNHPGIQRTTRGNVTNYSSISEQLPDIKIQECIQCGKEASKNCGNCKFTFYCSSECQQGNWSTHKLACKKIKQAQFGDLKYMRKIFSACMAKASQSSNESLINEGLSWHYRTLIRVRQDIACSKDHSTAAAVDRVKFDHGQLINQLVEQKILDQKKLEEVGKQAFKDALAWVREITEAKKLVSPVDIRSYGMAPFLQPSVDFENEFIPEDQWHEKRMDVLRKYEEMFQ